MTDSHKMGGLSSFRHLVFAALVVLLSAAAFAQEDVASVEGAQFKVEAFHAALMASARANGGFAVREPGVAAALDDLFDMQRIARISAGAAWRDLAADARADYVALLRGVVIGNYVSRFDADRGQSFATIGATEVKPQRFIVKSAVNRPGKKAIPLDYYFRGGRVFNVVADGVSDLSVRRADYAAILQASGFEGLMTHLRVQLASARAAIDSDDSGA